MPCDHISSLALSLAEVKQKGVQVARRVSLGAVVLLALVIGAGYLLGKRAAAGRGGGKKTEEAGKLVCTYQVPGIKIGSYCIRDGRVVLFFGRLSDLEGSLCC